MKKAVKKTKRGVVAKKRVVRVGHQKVSKITKAGSLVQSWLEVEMGIKGKNLTSVLKDLNKSLKSAHTHSRVREWEDNRNGRGERLPRTLRQYMAKLVLPYVLDAEGIRSKLSSKNLARLAERLS